MATSRFLVAGIAILAFFAVSAETFQSKDWVWGTDTESNGYYFALTTNQAENVLGQFCYFSSNSCLYIVGLGITCEEGNQYPALINSDYGATPVTLICGGKFQKQSILVVSPFEDIDRAVRQATRLGIVIPMENDQFKVSRFGLAGSTYAIDLMRTASEAKMNRQPQNASKPAEEIL